MLVHDSRGRPAADASPLPRFRHLDRARLLTGATRPGGATVFVLEVERLQKCWALHPEESGQQCAAQVTPLSAEQNTPSCVLEAAHRWPSGVHVKLVLD